MLEAIERLRAALNEAEKRQAARDLGAAIGSAIGTSSTLFRTDEQIEAMTLEEIDAWATDVEASISEGS